MLGKLLKNTFFFAVGPQVPRLVSIFLLPILTRYLTEFDYGVWGIITAYTGVLSGIKLLGMTQPIVNVYFNHPLRWKFFWELFMGMLHLWMFVFVILQSVILWFAIPDTVTHSNKLLIIFILGITVLIFDITNTFAFRLFQFKQKAKYIALVTAVSGIVTLVTSFYFIAGLKLGYLGWAFSTFAGSLTSFLFMVYPLYFKERIRPRFAMRKRFFVHHLKIGLPTVPHEYSSYLLNVSDRIVMSFYGIPTGQIGLYSFAYTFGNYAELGGEAMGMALSPMHLQLLAEKKEFLARKLLNTLQYLFVIGLFIIGLWAKEILQVIVSNPQLAGTYVMTALILFSYCYRPLYWGTVNLLGFKGKTNQLWKISFFAGLINLVLNLVFMPIFGYQVAIVTTFISLLFLGISGYRLKVFRTLSTENYQPFRWLIILVGGFILLYFAVEWNWIIKIVISLLLGILLFIQTRTNFTAKST